MKGSLKLLPTLLCAAVMAGCTSIPQSHERTSLSDLRENAVSGWESTPAMVYRTHRQGAQLLEPDTLPAKLYETPVELGLARRISVEELASIIQLAGVPTMLATDELAEVNVFVPSYNGPIGVLLDSLGAASSLSFSWNRGVLILDKDRPYLLRIPQNTELAEAISKALTSMGAADVQASKEAGLISFRASTQDRARITAYLDRLAVNTSMVNLQMAVMNVSLNEESSRGLDWSSIALKAGDLGLLKSAADAAAVAVEEGVEDVVTAPVQDVVTRGTAAALDGGGLSVVFKGSNLTLDAVLNMLSTYGESRTVQNLTLKTLSGVPVELRSGESIPYVEDMSLNVNEYSATSGVTTTTVDIGFEVEVSPFYDAEDNLVTVELDLSMKSLVGFRELSTGTAEGGTISRPQVQDQEIKNIARLEAGETALIGGLVYESVSDNRNTLTGLERLPVGSKKLKTSRNALFILLRPTVVVYGQRPVVSEQPAPEVAE
jgi:hypothetical protein